MSAFTHGKAERNAPADSHAMNAAIQYEPPALERPRLFCDPRWVSAFADSFGFDTDWCVCKRGDELVAALPLLPRRRLGRRYVNTPQMMPYNPVWFAPADDRPPGRVGRERLEACRAIAALLRDTFGKIDIALDPSHHDMRGFTWSGLQAQPRYTYHVDLSVDPRLHASKKNALHKAEREDFALHEERDLDSFITLQRLTMQRQGKRLAVPEPLQLKLLGRMLDEGFLRQFVVKADGAIVHTRLWLFDQHHSVVHAWQGVSDPQWLPRGVYTWSTLALMRLMRDEGRQTLDLGGANIDSIAQFKAGFGGQLKLYFRVSKPLPSLLGLLRGRRG
ncbi:MAG: GNAT family N-acetyltransferase [Candidatus Cloacimonetes bacterium]|nr:GNAT family N-acetyltransferase [Candidatus Cloacimonadota bacterium]